MSIFINNKKILGTEPSVNPGDLGLFAGSDDQFYVKKSDGTKYALGAGSASAITSVEIVNNQIIFTEANGATFGASGSFTGGGGGSSSVISITYSALMSLASSDSLDLSAIYKITDVGNTFSLCIEPYPVSNTGRGNVYVRPASTSVIDPNGTWEAEFKYTAKWVMNLSEYDFNRVWIGLTMSSLVLTPDDYAADPPESVVTTTELLSASVSFGSTLETFGTNLESSINANTINSGWEVYGWTISGIGQIKDYENVDINTTTTPQSITFSVLSMIIESSNPTSSYSGYFISGNYGSGYTFPPYGILGTSSSSGDQISPWYGLQNGLDSATYSLSCIYDPLTNDLIEVKDAVGNVWRGSIELAGIGVSSIYDYPIYMPGSGAIFTAFMNSNIESCYINEYNFINSLCIGSKLKSIWLGVDAVYGPSIVNSSITGDIQKFLYDDQYPSKILSSSIQYTSGFAINSSIIHNCLINDGFKAFYSVVSGSNIDSDKYSYNEISQTINRNNLLSSKGEVIRSSPDFQSIQYGKTFSLIKSSENGFWEIGYQTPHVASSGSPILMSIYLIQEDTFTSSLLLTASTIDLATTIFGSPTLVISNGSSYWSIIIAFDADVSVDKYNFTNYDLSAFNVWAKKI